MALQNVRFKKNFDYYIARVIKNPELLNRNCVVDTIFRLGYNERRFNLVGSKDLYRFWLTHLCNEKEAKYFCRLHYILTYLP